MAELESLFNGNGKPLVKGINFSFSDLHLFEKGEPRLYIEKKIQRQEFLPVIYVEYALELGEALKSLFKSMVGNFSTCISDLGEKLSKKEEKSRKKYSRREEQEEQQRKIDIKFAGRVNPLFNFKLIWPKEELEFFEKTAWQDRDFNALEEVVSEVRGTRGYDLVKEQYIKNILEKIPPQAEGTEKANMALLSIVSHAHNYFKKVEKMLNGVPMCNKNLFRYKIACPILEEILGEKNIEEITKKSSYSYFSSPFFIVSGNDFEISDVMLYLGKVDPINYLLMDREVKRIVKQKFNEEDYSILDVFPEREKKTRKNILKRILGEELTEINNEMETFARDPRIASKILDTMSSDLKNKGINGEEIENYISTLKKIKQSEIINFLSGVIEETSRVENKELYEKGSIYIINKNAPIRRSRTKAVCQSTDMRHSQSFDDENRQQVIDEVLGAGSILDKLFKRYRICKHDVSLGDAIEGVDITEFKYLNTLLSQQDFFRDLEKWMKEGRIPKSLREEAKFGSVICTGEIYEDDLKKYVKNTWSNLRYLTESGKPESGLIINGQKTRFENTGLIVTGDFIDGLKKNIEEVVGYMKKDESRWIVPERIRSWYENKIREIRAQIKDKKQFEGINLYLTDGITNPIQILEDLGKRIKEERKEAEISMLENIKIKYWRTPLLETIYHLGRPIKGKGDYDIYFIPMGEEQKKDYNRVLIFGEV
ncbi:MAG: hypothetical protein IB618_04260 [Candidatus Pacearchaeota archaeon]|nr:MAG: hypothetical protein IB618_04260 [Candidatus Pacearchaeota archaeon]